MTRNTATGVWQMLGPDAMPTFVIALNHMASPYYYDVIEGAEWACAVPIVRHRVPKVRPVLDKA